MKANQKRMIISSTINMMILNIRDIFVVLTGHHKLHQYEISSPRVEWLVFNVLALYIYTICFIFPHKLPKHLFSLIMNESDICSDSTLCVLTNTVIQDSSILWLV